MNILDTQKERSRTKLQIPSRKVDVHKELKKLDEIEIRTIEGNQEHEVVMMATDDSSKSSKELSHDGRSIGTEDTEMSNTNKKTKEKNPGEETKETKKSNDKERRLKLLFIQKHKVDEMDEEDDDPEIKSLRLIEELVHK